MQMDSSRQIVYGSVVVSPAQPPAGGGAIINGGGASDHDALLGTPYQYGTVVATAVPTSSNTTSITANGGGGVQQLPPLRVLTEGDPVNISVKVHRFRRQLLWGSLFVLVVALAALLTVTAQWQRCFNRHNQDPTNNNNNAANSTGQAPQGPPSRSSGWQPPGDGSSGSGDASSSDGSTTGAPDSSSSSAPSSDSSPPPIHGACSWFQVNSTGMWGSDYRARTVVSLPAFAALWLSVIGMAAIGVTAAMLSKCILRPNATSALVPVRPKNVGALKCLIVLLGLGCVITFIAGGVVVYATGLITAISSSGLLPLYYALFTVFIGCAMMALTFLPGMQLWHQMAKLSTQVIAVGTLLV